MKSEEVYRAVRGFVSNHDHKFQNVFVHSWEADHFSVTSSGYSYEIEVKISRSDFLADFKKPKHHLFKSFKTGYGILRLGESWISEGWPLINKHPELKNYRITYNNISPVEINHKSCPNKFYYAVPVGLIEVHEVPPYAGLLYVMDHGDIREMKKAPFLHKDGFDVRQMLFNKYYWLCNELREKVRGLEWTVEDLKEKLEKQTV